MLIGLLVVVLAIAVEGRSEAAIFDVDNTADAVDAVPGDGTCATAGAACTLRAAIQEANASAAADVINLPSGTYALGIAGTGEDAAETGDLDIPINTGSLTLNGGGASTTIIDGGDLDRVLHVGSLDGTCCAAAAIADVTIQNGNTTDEGGGIFNTGALTLTRVILRDNESFRGGGIANNIGGTVTMTASLVTGNAAISGGGVSQFADSPPMSLSNVTISGNRATGNGGGVYSAMFMIAMNNVTVTGNTADSDDNGTGNGGGVFATFLVFIGGNISLANTIVAGNADSGGEAPDCAKDSFGAITSQGYNLIGDTTGCTLSGSTTGNLNNLDPLLGSLTDNGGPTFTHALLAGSPARDTANPAAPGSGGGACAAADQRGIARPFGPRCDKGAFEDTTPDGMPTPTPTVTPPPGGTLDHYKCYQGIDLKTPPFSQRTADTADQLSDETVGVRRVKFVCVPVNKNGEGINDPAAHLVCYQTSAAGLAPRPVVEVSSQFQTSRFELKRPKLLCLPATKMLIP